VVRCHRIARARLGQALVESALVFPVLMLLVLGSADLGRIFYYSIAITNAAREGARYGTYYDPTNPGSPNASAANVPIYAAVQAEMPAGISVTQPYPPGNPSACPTQPYADFSYPTQPNTAAVYVCFNENYVLTSGTPGQTIRVVVLFNFTPVTPMVASFASSSVHMEATSTMVVQGQA
jgi:Flp pilus assembly protein TadG